MAEKITGSLAQKYAEILMGLFAKAIIDFQIQKEQKKQQSQPQSLIIQPDSIQTIISKVEQTFGDFKLDQDLQHQSRNPVIHSEDLRAQFKKHLRAHELPLEMGILRIVLKDFFRLKILLENFSRQTAAYDPLYEINTAFFNSQEIEKRSLNLKEALDLKLLKEIKNTAAREILMHLALLKSFTEEEYARVSQTDKRFLSTIIVSSRYIRGILFGRLYLTKNIGYHDFMNALSLLVQNGLVIESCDDRQEEYVFLSPLLKPFSVVAALIRSLIKQEDKTQIIEIETSEDTVSPLGNMISLNSLNPNSRDIYLFEGFEIGLKGL